MIIYQIQDPDEICIAINPRNGMWHDVMCTEANVPACERGKCFKRLLNLTFATIK